MEANGVSVKPEVKFGIDAAGSNRHAALKLLRDVIIYLRWKFYLIIGLSIILGIVGLLPSLLYRYFAINLSTQTTKGLVSHLAIFGGLLSITFLISTLGSTICQEWIGMKVEVFLRSRVLKQVHRLPLEVLDAGQRGDLMTSMSRDIFSVELFFMNSIPGQVREFAMVIGSAAMFCYYSGAFALIPLGTALLLTLFSFRVQQRLSPYLQELRFLRGGIFQVMIESLEGVRTIRSHQSESWVEKRFIVKLEEAQDKTMYVARQMGLLRGRTELFTKFLIAFCLCMVAWLFNQRKLSLDEVFLFPFLTGIFYDSVSGFTDKLYHWNRFFNEASRVAGLIYFPRSAEHATLQVCSSEKLIHQVNSIVLQNLSVGYPEKTLLSSFDFILKRGDLWVIMGPSGSGKSTFLEVIAGLRAAQSLNGQVLGVGSQKLSFTFQQRGLLLPVEICGYVEQHPYLFEGTLRENLNLGSGKQYLDAELLSSLEALGLSDIFEKRKGLESRILERGKNLSVGERYRVGLCRTILLQRPFLLLDEPFAAQDEVSTRRIADWLKGSSSTLGIAIVTHLVPDSLSPTGMISFNGNTVRVNVYSPPSRTRMANSVELVS